MTNDQLTPENYAAVRYFPVSSSGSGANPPASREPLQVCNDGINNDLDAATDLFEDDSGDAGTLMDCNPRGGSVPGSPATAGQDTDGDGYSNANEIFIGTDPMGRCEKSGTGAGASSDWPGDLSGGITSGDKLTLTDVSTVSSSLGSRPGFTPPGKSPYSARVDMVPGTVTPGATQAWIILLDLSNITTLTPPMFNNGAVGGSQKAFASLPVCAAHLTIND
jgi:hypothetical protein